MWAFMGYGLVIGVGIGLAIGVVVVVPTLVYAIPYALWLGWHCGENGIPRSAGKNGNLFKQALNATKLYRSWITHKPHNITDW